MNRTSQDGRGTVSTPGARPVPPDDRYRRGARRTGAEPLAASWEPAGRPRGGRARGLKGWVANYGWRVYAVPVLLVLTALVVLDTATPGDDAGDGKSGQAMVTTTTQGPPVASETPPVKVDPVNIPTAVLPDGPKFSEQGAGTWQVVPGTTAQVGQGATLYKYAIAVEDGVEAADYGGDREAFARTIDGVLADNRSWIGTGQVAMQRVDDEQAADFVVSLTTTTTTHKLCGVQIQYETSCWQPTTKRVVINTARWVRGAKVFSNDLSTYRAYVINHEVGHALRNNHEGCKEHGQPAPVMMQQTFGVANDYVAQLNEVDSSNRGVVPNDGKVCTPNAFPVAPR